MYNRNKEIQAILRSSTISAVFHNSVMVYSTSGEVHINTNPDPHRYIPIDKLSQYYQKDFEHDYWYMSLFYFDSSFWYCTNLFYWKRSDLVSYAQVGSVMTVSHEPQAECYNYFNTCSSADNFNYNVGSDSIPGKFDYNTSSAVARVYLASGSVKWTSPACVGIETNIPIIL